MLLREYQASGSPSLSFQPDICGAKQPTQASSNLVRHISAINTKVGTEGLGAVSFGILGANRMAVAAPLLRQLLAHTGVAIHDLSWGPRWTSLESLSAECLWEDPPATLMISQWGANLVP